MFVLKINLESILFLSFIRMKIDAFGEMWTQHTDEFQMDLIGVDMVLFVKVMN